jgi:serine/threonine-protein kinase
MSHPTPPEPGPIVADEFATVVPADTPWHSGLPAALPAHFGRFTLERLLGKGGMGAVYLAQDAQLERLVALKFPHGSSSPDDRERFLREARAAAAVTHPNLCPVHDACEVDGIAYLVLAYIEGEPLSALIKREPLPPRVAARLTAQVARALQAAHCHGILHRDLKPANVMITPDGRPVVLDFGLARRAPDTGDLPLTHTGVRVGTPPYMAPEQVNAEPLTPACDIYGLGVLLYETLTGQLPFTGPLGALFAKIITTPPPPPSNLRPGLDPGLEAVCLRALAKEPAARFATMEAFAAALEPFAHESVAVPPLAKPAQTPVPVAGEGARLQLAARYYMEKRTEDGVRQAIATYRHLLDADPACAPAWAGLASAYRLLSVWGHAAPTAACPKARAAALRAVTLDGTLGEAYSTLAAVQLEYDWDLTAAEATFHQALALAPASAEVLMQYGKCLACLGRFDEAIAALRRAEELDPLSPTASNALGRHGYLLARRYDEAVRQFQKSLETEPGFWLSHRFLGWAQLFRGDHAAALAAFEAARRCNDGPMTQVGVAYAHAAAGRPAPARAALAALTPLADTNPIVPDACGLLCIGLGDRGAALTWLYRAAEGRSEWLSKIAVDPMLDALRGEPRFVELRGRVKGIAG